MSSPTPSSSLSQDEIRAFKERASKVEACSDCLSLAEEILEAGDREWAIQLYKRSETYIEKPEDMRQLLRSIRENLGTGVVIA